MPDLSAIEVEEAPFQHLTINSLSEQHFWLIAQFTSLKHHSLHALSLTLFHNMKATDAAQIAGCEKSQVTRAKINISNVIERLTKLHVRHFSLCQLSEQEFESVCAFLKKNTDSNAIRGVKLVLFKKLKQTDAANIINCKKQLISACSIDISKSIEALHKLSVAISQQPIKIVK